MRRARTPLSSQLCSNSSSAPTSPETATDATPFTAAMLSRSPHSVSHSRTCWAPHPTDAIPPAPANCTSNRLRNATTRRHPQASTPRPHTPRRSHPGNDRSPHQVPPPRNATPPPTTPSPQTTPAAPHPPDPAPAHPSPRTTSLSDHSTHRPNAAPHRISREHRRRIQQLLPHPQPLRPLPGKHQHRLTRRPARPTTTAAPGRRLSQPGQPRQRCPDHTRQHRPMLKHRPPRQRHTPHRPDPNPHQPDIREQPPRLSGQRLTRLARQHPGTTGILTPGLHPRRCLTDGRGLLQDHMRIGPADPKRRHPRPPRTPCRPRPSPVNNDTAPADQSTCGTHPHAMSGASPHAASPGPS